MHIARLISLFALFALPASALAERPLVLGGSTETRHVVVGADGETHVGVWVEAPVIEETVVRAPISLSLVMDVSGSMNGGKIQHAKMAASSLVESLADGDRVSLVTFNEQVQVLHPHMELSPSTRAAMHRRIQGITAMGGTNLHGGLGVGIQHAASGPSSHPVRRVVLISDGQANVGPSDPYSLGNLSAAGSEQRVQVSAIGVGLDYDERSLSEIAVRSAGRFYHLADPGSLASILESEIGLLARTVATDVILEIVPGSGVIILECLTPGARLEGGTLRLPIGALHSGQRRELLFRARVQDGDPGAKKLASARLHYARPGGAAAHSSRNISVELTRDRAVARASGKDTRVSALVAEYRATAAELRAAEALAEGDRAAALVELREAEQAVVHAAAAAPRSSESRRRLDAKAAKIRSTRSSADAAATPAAQRAVGLESRVSAMKGFGY